MNPQSDQIRALIDEIDELLHGGSNSFIWRFSGDRARHQDTLERLRRYLATLQHTLRIRNLPGSEAEQLPILLSGQSHNPFAIQEATPDALAQDGDVSDSDNHEEATELEVRPLGYQDSDALLDQLSTELAQLREGLLGPLQQEVQALRQKRNDLQEEVTQLEIRRVQQQTPDQEALLHQFIETLMGRLQERMVKQVATILQEAMPRIVASQTAALPAAEAEQVQQLQQRANTLLNNMDSTIQVFSQTLEQNIQAYQQSLSVGLERMHSLGRQGELMVSGLVNRLAEQMEHQTAAYLQAPGQSFPGVSVGTDQSVMAPAAVQAQSASMLAATTQASAALPSASPATEDLVQQQAQWEANAAVPSQWQSTSSAGIVDAGIVGTEATPAAPGIPAPQTLATTTASEASAQPRAIAEQNLAGLSETEVQAASQASVPTAPTSDLDAFYAGFDEIVTATRQVLTEELATYNSDTEQPSTVDSSAATDAQEAKTATPQRYRNLEEALFEGIPDGELWTSPWENMPDIAATLPTAEAAASESPAQPDEAHTIHSLTDLVSRTTQDLEQLQQGQGQTAVAAAVMEPPVAPLTPAADTVIPDATAPEAVTSEAMAPEAAAPTPIKKKKPTPPPSEQSLVNLRPYLLRQPPRQVLPSAS